MTARPESRARYHYGISDAHRASGQTASAHVSESEPRGDGPGVTGTNTTIAERGHHAIPTNMPLTCTYILSSQVRGLHTNICDLRHILH